ncbi:hypothetical protein OKA04_16385 [Luteolibacter flavescens]|uniref:Ice-binding protein C-terminal domain-containing protein n=1 Tax=Luteolibacter flavescens TaxID=1859460 RepID=A0ABT3FRW0_9BACT|nr:PEP-CTERM sorting domain-containing protein [Luteolibacter flavescens]MCW1886317.1 hypothetical protein [Luteolibacter flavescens]
MKSLGTHPMKTALATGLLATVLSTGAASAVTLISSTVNNGSFESVDGVVNTSYIEKVTQFDGAAAGEVDNWTIWSSVATNFNNSGTEVWSPAPAAPVGPDGIRFAFLQPGNAIYNLTSHTIQAGDMLSFSWDHIRGRNLSHTVTLVYFDGTNVLPVPATEVFATASSQSYSGTFTIPAGSLAIGHTLGLGIVNTSDNWVEVDNFKLDTIPEPSVALLGALGLLGFSRRRRSC